jgi:thiol:disulfide interchange protein DsbD
LSLLSLLWLIPAGPLTAEQNDPFAVQNQAASKSERAAKEDADDPFAPANSKKPGQAAPVRNDPESTTAARTGKPTPIDERINFDITLTPRPARRGEIVHLKIVGTPKPGFHTYPLTQRSPDQDPSQLSTLTYGSVPGLRPLWPVVESTPEPKREEGLGWFLEHEQPFTWEQDLLILPEATPGDKILPLTIKAQVCNASSCVWGDPQFEVKLDVSAADPVPLTPALEERRLKAKQPELKVVALPGSPAPLEAVPDIRKPAPKTVAPPGKAEPNMAAAPAKSDGSGLIAFILQGVVWGYISLLTPCVFPMIPITVSFFLKQSEKEHHKPVLMALVYSATIVLVLTAGAVLLLRFFQELSQYWSTNLLLGALFLVFALSLFGMYEIRLPSGLANFTSARESRGGLAGTIFMALTFTIISFACVAPFLGGFAGISVQARPWYEVLLGGLAYSVTFATPFSLLALFPTWLRRLPKSGSWMNAMKVVMGFFEVAAALKFLRAAELLRFGRAEFLTYDLVLGFYVALAILCALYLLNLYRLPHDHEVPEHLGVPRFLFSLVFLSLGLYLMPALFKQGSGELQRPAGSVFAWLDAFLLPEPPETGDLRAPADARRSAAGPSKSAIHLAWIGNFEKGLQTARDQRKLMFVDFTGLT